MGWVANGGRFFEADLVRNVGEQWLLVVSSPLRAHMGCLHASALCVPGAGPARVCLEIGVGHIQWLLAMWHESLCIVFGCDVVSRQRYCRWFSNR